MIITYKFKLRHKSYAKRLRRQTIALNQVWNYNNSLQRQLERNWRAGAPSQKWLSEYDYNKVTAGVSKDLNVHAGSIHEINRYFTQARDKRKRSLSFRVSFGAKRALGFIPFRQSDRKVSGNSIRYLGKTYCWFGDRPLPTNPKNVKGGAFVEDALGDWWICLQVEVEKDNEHGDGAVGVDLGLKTLATLSDGNKIENPKVLAKWAEKLAVAQRANNKRQVKRIHKRITNIRNDFQHKETKKLIDTYSYIAVGDVNSPRLAKTKMAKSVLDASWGGFRYKLRYKASRHGVVYIDVNEKFTSQVCSSCQLITDSSPKGMDGLGIRSWVCSCGASHDRDVNAAKNILRIGLSAQPLAEGNG